MGTAGTYLFIPFILLVIGFFAFLFYPVVKSDAEMSKRTSRPAQTQDIQRKQTEAEDET